MYVLLIHIFTYIYGDRSIGFNGIGPKEGTLPPPPPPPPDTAVDTLTAVSLVNSMRYMYICTLHYMNVNVSLIIVTVN